MNAVTNTPAELTDQEIWQIAIDAGMKFRTGQGVLRFARALLQHTAAPVQQDRVLDKSVIKRLACQTGFSLKAETPEGPDLKPYVYNFAQAIARYVSAPAQSVQPQAAPSVPKLRYIPACEVTIEQREQALKSDLYKHGDMRLIWINEGDLCMSQMQHLLAAAPAAQAPVQAERSLSDEQIRKILVKYSKCIEPGVYSSTEFDCADDLLAFTRALLLAQNQAPVTAGEQGDLLRALRSVRTSIRQIKKTANEFDETLEICIKADKRATEAINSATSAAQAPDAKDAGWISVKDRLPKPVDFFCEPIDSVVVARWHGNFMVAWNKARYVQDEVHGKFGWFMGGEPLDFNPTHWEPLPPAPSAAMQENGNTAEGK
jgi:hypothetical protein